MHQDLGFITSIDNQKDLPGLYDRPDTHRVGKFGHFIRAGEVAGIGFDRARIEPDLVRHLAEGFIRLVESDVAVVADAQQLQIDATEFADQMIVAGTFGSRVLGQAIGQMGVLLLDVDLAEQVER